MRRKSQNFSEIVFCQQAEAVALLAMTPTAYISSGFPSNPDSFLSRRAGRLGVTQQNLNSGLSSSSPRYRPQLPNDICLTQGWGGIGLETDCLKLSSRVVCRRLSRRHPVRSSLRQQFTLWRGEIQIDSLREVFTGGWKWFWLSAAPQRTDFWFHRLFWAPAFFSFHSGGYLASDSRRYLRQSE